MDPRALAVHQRLNEDFWFFSRNAPLLIKTKDGQLVPLGDGNIGQRYLHDKLEEQRKKYGWVRAVVPKARQVGCSTYINGRFYWRTSRRPHTSAFVLSHEGDSTTAIFNMVRRYDDHVQPALRPKRGADNPRAMDWPGIGSDYSAATAKNDQAGRSRTAQLFHGSEPAYWEYAYEIQDGALKIVSLVPGTEIILESTANGPVGFFFEKCMAALADEERERNGLPRLGDYILVFIPWFWQDEYERTPEPDFTPTEAEEKFAAANFAKPFPYSDRPIPRAKVLRKLRWRRGEIQDLATEGGGNLDLGLAKFRTIYPSNPVEAFQSTGAGLFRADAITAARASTYADTVGARIAGVDPAGNSDNADRTVISIRQGKRIEKRYVFPRMEPMELCGRIINLIRDENLDMVFIDRGYGEGTINRLYELGHGAKVCGVYFNERPMDEGRFANKRTEMFYTYADWINGGGVRIPDDDQGHAALASIPPGKPNSNGLLQLPPKDVIKKAAGASVCQDLVDADVLTFAYPVQSRAAVQANAPRRAPTRKNPGTGGSSILRGSRA